MSTPHQRRPLLLNAPKQRQGQHFETQALRFLQQQGLTLIAQNWQQPKIGEIDLIMIEQGSAWPILVFVEVRQRARSQFGDASMSITKAKQRKLIKAARYFLQQHPQYADYECRFDVVTYDGTHQSDHANYLPQYAPNMPAVTWIQGAFMANAW